MPREKPKAHDRLEVKFELLTRLPFDSRMKRTHILIYGFILNWYHKDYGDALASVRHIQSQLKDRDPAKQGLGIRHIHGALTDLVDWGYLQQTKGAGKRASRYVPVWALAASSVPPVGNTNDNDPSVPPGGNTTVPPVGNATALSVPPGGNEDPSTQTRVTDPETGIDGYDCAAPTARPLSPVPGVAAGTAQGGFEELWAAYAYRRNIKAARAAYKALAPDAPLHAIMVEAAVAWQKAWAAQRKPDAPRKYLNTWIQDEDYECEPPTAYKPKERAASTSKQRSETASGEFRITAVERLGDSFSEQSLRLVGLTRAGKEVSHVLEVFTLEGTGKDFDAYNQICRGVDDTDIKTWVGTLLAVKESKAGRLFHFTEDRRTVTVTAARVDLEVEEDEVWVSIEMQDEGGDPLSRLLPIHAAGRGVDREKAEYKRMVKAAGIKGDDDVAGLVGIQLVMSRAADGAFQYAPDKQMREAA